MLQYKHYILFLMALFLEREQCHKTYAIVAASNSVNLTKLLDC